MGVMKLYCKECQEMKCTVGELVCDDCKQKIIRCSYCDKISSLQFTLKAKIYINGEQREMRFCNNTCASYYQMGAEG